MRVRLFVVFVALVLAVLPAASAAGYAPTSFWTHPPTAAVSRTSAMDVRKLLAQVEKGVSIDVEAPVWTVSSSTANVTVPVCLTNSSDNEPVTSGPLYDALHTLLQSVTLPATTDLAGVGTDDKVVIDNATTGSSWEFSHFVQGNVTSWCPSGYMAWTAGYTPNVSTANGIFTPPLGARTGGFPLQGGLVMMSEYSAGAIPHELGLVVCDTNGFHAPADASRNQDRCDAGLKNALPYGDQFKLPASYNCSAFTVLLEYELCVAAQVYGVVVVDNAGDVHFQLQDPRTAGTQWGTGDPFSWPSTAALDAAAAAFPYANLQEDGPCRTAGCTPDPVP